MTISTHNNFKSLRKDFRLSVGIWSTIFKEPNGQSIVTKRVSDLVSSGPFEKVEYKFSEGAGFIAILQWIISFARILFNCLFRRIQVLYLVCSRSNAGFIRDIPALLTSLGGVNVVVHTHGSDIKDLLEGRFISPIARYLYKNVCLIVPSSHLLEELSNHQFKDIVVCENFFQFNKFSPEREIINGKLRVLWNSNIISSKGFFTLWEACENAIGEGLKIELTVLGAPIGDIEMSKIEIKGKIDNLLNSTFATFLGIVPPERADQLAYEADVVALPSRYSSECQPLSLIAAMCAGTHIIAGRTAALQATIQDYPAEFVDPFSTSDITDALIKIHNLNIDPNYDSRGTYEEARRRAIIRFSIDRFDDEITRTLLKYFEI